MKAAITWAIIGLMALPAGWASRVSSREMDFFCLFNLTERADGYYTMIDQADGAVLLKTARIVQVGTEFIDGGNRRFRVVKIKEDTAVAEQIGGDRPAAAASAGGAWTSLSLPLQAVEEGRKPRVGIYHSHGAESFVPSDGTDSIIEGGGILDVGEKFENELEKQGVEATQVTETHVPHDAGAYMRSRGTAKQLITEENKDLIIDVHRDATPAEAYETEVNGEKVTHILLVVGAQNQNAANNRQLAEDLKAVSDEKYPGLVKGILDAPGSYNQDLAPNAILIEVGAHENRKEEAKRSVAMFADVVATYLTDVAAAPEERARQGRIALERVLIVLAVLAASVMIYLYISAGSWEEMKRKATSFFKREFADLSRGFKRKRNDDGDRG